MSKKMLAALAVAAMIGGCASPTVVDRQKLGDETLSCAQLEAEIKEAERYKEAAAKEKGVTGTNVAAALFFWPAMLATHSNANEAIAAADNRKEHLMGIYNKQGCSADAATASTQKLTPAQAQESLEKLTDMKNKGLITQEEFDAKRAAIVEAI